MDSTVALQGAGPASGMCRATVAAVHPDGTVTIVTDEGGSVTCDVLVPAGGGLLDLNEGDRVLTWNPAPAQEPGIILGVIGPRTAGGANGHRLSAGTDADPEELLISAKRSLTLKVGDGSITIREDGKILIKGTHLVSHAKTMNRVRGGSVAIN
ncbi:MAG TPA: hypothetical protein VMM12_05920 [Longimicrobiales bacterium]|nr:hypothetical protein [Longimicrobiales bacterium]